MEKGEASMRLREAIQLDDTSLVRRLLTHRPDLLQNPNFEDKSNTSLHLAALYGHTEIAEYLISLGHDRETESKTEDYIYSPHKDNLGVSVNTDGHCPLHLAAMYSRPDIVRLLCQQFPHTVNRPDNKGTTPLHLAAGAHAMPRTHLARARARAASTEDVSVIEHLVAHGANVNAQDRQGDTCLHYATAWGNLKAVRALIQAGAIPVSKNWAGWTADSYSLTVQAEVYYKALVTEWEKRLEDETLRETERRAQGARSVRLVSDDSDDLNSEQSRSRADSERSQATTRSGSDMGLGITVGKVDTWK
ncbi:uncharacterized protein HMPREF1541_00845 [Cyphellophora europaea CBS 101466]|uniref:Uncharacterized protein n=1 Tax=Cyphellophora europaea (strain CBS 101466) TaxID=1220924 RepID=W2SFH4_CYPE1|nr:uncharacterized protein HMPREF1541_00845 [Cyphellophora europaea CBS 101466]ETN46659.1 hypothetical protein HMPREF1541_00845 [Cyphellophora europaea CBS 101466]